MVSRNRSCQKVQLNLGLWAICCQALALEGYEMQVMSRTPRILGLFFALVLLQVLPASAERPRPLGWAMEAMRDGNWDTARDLAARDGPVATDVIRVA